MVIGNGLIARRFDAYRSNEKFLVFASGVSNSKDTNPQSFQRERSMLEQAIEANPAKQFVYFSTCSIYDPQEANSAYVLHKKAMESLVEEKATRYHIFRISNLVGQTPNAHTVLNFFINHIRTRQHFQLWKHAVRNIIDVDDAFSIIDHILKQDLFLNQVTNIANPHSTPVKEIVSTVESFLNTKAQYTEVDKGSGFHIDISPVMPLIDQRIILFDNAYLSNLLAKYYL